MSESPAALISFAVWLLALACGVAWLLAHRPRCPWRPRALERPRLPGLARCVAAAWKRAAANWDPSSPAAGLHVGGAMAALTLTGMLILHVGAFVQRAAPPRHPAEPASDLEASASFADDFALGGFELPARSHPFQDQLEPRRPDHIHLTPRFDGDRQWWGELRLGEHRKRFDFVYDVAGGSSPLLHVDLNGNTDLTDDGPPLHNSGSGYFAATARFPAQLLFDDYRGEDDFEVWMFTNREELARGRSSHYSRTQAHGEIRLGGQRRLASLADRGANDADLRNDGVFVDVDGDGRLDKQAEYFAPPARFVVDGRGYRFTLR